MSKVTVTLNKAPLKYVRSRLNEKVVLEVGNVSIIDLR